VASVALNLQVPGKQSVAVLLMEDKSGAPSVQGTQQLLLLAQQLAAVANQRRVLVMTHGAISSEAACGSSGAAFGGEWGFVRVLRLEHAALRAQSIDISLSVSIAAAAALFGAEEEVAWHGDTT